MGSPPATLGDLEQAAGGVAATGATPWCLGVEADDEAGWAAVDWVETLMLVNHGRTVFEQWVDHEIPFDDPRVVDVLGQVEALLLEEGQTFGGRDAIEGTEVDAADDPLFTEPPGCHLYRQNTLVAQDAFPDAVVEDLDTRVGVFPVPGTTADEKPVLGGGHLAGVLDQGSGAAQDLVRFLASPEFGTHGYAESGTWISPRRDFDTERYPTELWRTVGGIAHGATEFVLDGSQRMPDAVGAGSFPRELTAWISGEQDAATTLAAVEESWPEA
jgi:alpha-glucoside transport system substrate-binding protein